MNRGRESHSAAKGADRLHHRRADSQHGFESPTGLSHRTCFPSCLSRGLLCPLESVYLADLQRGFEPRIPTTACTVRMSTSASTISSRASAPRSVRLTWLG